VIDRRKFLSYVPAVTIFGTLGGLAMASEAATSQSAQSIGAIETLMRGHGLLLRATIIYDVSRKRLAKGQKLDPALILKTAQFFHDYLQRFHEVLEEKYIFAPMEQNDVCSSSIQELKVQHGAGYELTQRVMHLAQAGKTNSGLVGYLSDFVQMYQHHCAWEDTVIFPAFDAMEKPQDLSELAAVFEEEEKKMFGHDCFTSYLNLIADVEKQLNIYELATSTPKL
jgi:hemerythrin-like domain-containing protein